MWIYRESAGQLVFLKLLLPLIAGIILAAGLPFGPWIYWGAMLLAFVVAWAIGLHPDLRWQSAQSVLWGIALLLLGVQIQQQSMRNFVALPAEKNAVWLLEICDEWNETTKSYRTEALVLAQADTLLACPATVLLYLPKLDTLPPAIRPGQRLWASASFVRLQNMGNPNEFDYAAYQARKGVYYAAFLKEGEYQAAGRNEGFVLWYWAKEFRMTLLARIRSLLKTEKQYSVAAALSFGYKNALDPETKAAFSNSGAMHILAVSGLHVGIIYGLFLRIFSLMRGHVLRRYVKPALLIAVLWLFALLAGLAPSVVRAALMFSIFVLGDAMGGKTNFFNKLAAAAFFMLLLRPDFLFDVGFQLSFAAVASIVYFQRFFARYLRSGFWLSDMLLELFAISVIAQLGTTGIGLYYFHQFPNYFVLTNIFAVPLASFIVILSVLVLPLSYLPAGLLSEVAAVYRALLDALIGGVEWVDSLPGAVTEHVAVSNFQLIIFYLALFAFGYWLHSRKWWWLRTALVFVLCYTLYANWMDRRNDTRCEFTVFNVKGHTTLGLVEGGLLTFFADSAVLGDKSLGYVARAYLLKYAFSEERTLFMALENSDVFYRDFAQVAHKRLYRLARREQLHYRSPEPFPVDWVLVSGNVQADLASLLDLVSCELLIIDSSNSASRSRAWKEQCRARGIACYDVASQGAFVFSHK